MFLEVTQNLFLVTNKLQGSSEETEMEDLFEDQILEQEIGGKIFSKNGESNKNYGKEIFSKFVLKNYEKINFENFRSILDNLNKIIVDYNKK